jgi:dTMP kinase
MPGSFIVIEGPDGSGKSTQIGLLCRHLRRVSIKYRLIHFPRYHKRPYGRLISSYLRGEFGSAETVNPYLASVLYAADRKGADRDIRQWIEAGDLVIADRYYLSNLAYQGAKIKDPVKKAEFRKWLYDLEFKHNGIKAPDLYLYLDVPTDFLLTNTSQPRMGANKAYLKGCKDIHECDMDFQRRVLAEYAWIAKRLRQVTVVECYDKGNSVLSPKKIHSLILEQLTKRRII